jgi:hypothetical protein
MPLDRTSSARTPAAGCVSSSSSSRPVRTKRGCDHNERQSNENESEHVFLLGVVEISSGIATLEGGFPIPIPDAQLTLRDRDVMPFRNLGNSYNSKKALLSWPKIVIGRIEECVNRRPRGNSNANETRT